VSTTYIHRACDLESFASLPWSTGVQLGDLRALETLEVRTKNTVYEITVTDPSRGEVLVRGGTFFPVYTRVRLAGASLAGSFLKVFGIYVGFSIEFCAGGETIVTTRVRKIDIVPSRSLS
jgi:hypothetical protein